MHNVEDFDACTFAATSVCLTNNNIKFTYIEASFPRNHEIAWPAE
jgi:hypothetical protein